MRLLLTLAAGLGLMALPGCAAKQTTKLSHPDGSLLLPIECIDSVIGGTKETRCEVLPKKNPNSPDLALCKGGMIVRFHCTKVKTQ